MKNLNAPNLLILGFAKCGTTAMYQLLIQHAEIGTADARAMAPWNGNNNKEPQIFRGRPHDRIKWCRSMWPDDTRYRIEATPGNILANGVLDAAATYCPDARILVLMREPVAKIVSLWNHYTWVLENKPPANGNWGMTEDTFEKQVEHALKAPGMHMLQGGHYAERIEEVQKRWHANQIHYMFLDDMISHPEETRAAIWKFLDLHPYEGIKVPGPHHYPKMFDPTEEILEKLHNYFLPHNRALQELMDIPKGWPT